MGTISIDELLDHVVQTGVKQYREPTHPPAEQFARFLRQDLLRYDLFSSDRMRLADIHDVERTLKSLGNSGQATHVNLSSLGESVLTAIKCEGSEIGKKLGLTAQEAIPSILKQEFITALQQKASEQSLDIEDDLSALANKLPDHITGSRDFEAAISAAFGNDYWGDLDEIDADLIVSELCQP